jgi:hypothetical protein
MPTKGSPIPRTSSDCLERVDRHRRCKEAWTLCDLGVSLLHYHIRWHPTGQLDWECFSNVEAATGRVKEIRLSGETFSIEQCDRSRLLVGPKFAPTPVRVQAAS